MKISRIISSKTLFFLLTTSIILTLNLTPLIMQFRHAPVGRTFALIHNNAQDFFFYQSLMNEGANGAWLTSDPYTSEPHQSSIIFSYFLWLGKLSKLFGLPYAVTYHLMRIFLSILFLFFIFYFLYFISVPYPRLTYLFFLFASPFMHTINDYGTINSVPFMNWWTGMDPIRRVAYLPHHMAGGLLLVITIILLIKYFQQQKQQRLKGTPGVTGWAPPGWRDQLKQSRIYLLLILLIPLLAFIHTPSLLILLLILPPSIFFYLILNGKLSLITPSIPLGAGNYQLPITKFIGLLGYWVIGLFFLLLMISQTRSGFPWSQYIDWEKKLQFPLDKELIGALGILFPFSILGAWQAIKSKKFENILVVCWLFAPFLFIPIAPKIGLSNIRLIQGVPYLPLSILAIYGIQEIVARISNIQFPISKQFKNLKIKKFIGLLGYWVIGLLFIIFTYPTLKWSLQDQIREYWPIFGNVYLDNRLENAFYFVNQNFPAKTITLSTFYTGNYLPAFTRTVSFIGHFGYTYNIDEKDKKVRKFFENKMSVEEVKDFLTGNKIALIWQGPEEKPIYKDYLYPKILKPVYDREEVTLYTPNL